MSIKDTGDAELINLAEKRDKQAPKVDRSAYTYDNLKYIFGNDSNLKSLFGYNEFTGMKVMVKKPVWNTPGQPYNDGTYLVTETDEVLLRNYIRNKYHTNGDKKALFNDLLANSVSENSFNPVTEYLNKCFANWDGEERINKLFIEYLGIEDTELNRVSTMMMLKGTVARAYNPGIKFDYMGILTGSQGVGKTTLLNKLGGEWYTDALVSMSEKDDFISTLGSLIVNDDELTAFKNTSIDAVKRFVTRITDSMRMPYDKRNTDYKRRFTIWGTTNETSFLNDGTGLRRFLVFECSKERQTKDVIKKLTADEIAQIWGEAVAMYKRDNSLTLSELMEQQADINREKYRDVDDTAKLIQQYLNILLPTEWYQLSLKDKQDYISNAVGDAIPEQGTEARTRVTIKEVLSELLRIDINRPDTKDYKVNAANARAVLNGSNDWEYKKHLRITGNSVPTTGYQRM